MSRTRLIGVGLVFFFPIPLLRFVCRSCDLCEPVTLSVSVLFSGSVGFFLVYSIFTIRIGDISSLLSCQTFVCENPLTTQPLKGSVGVQNLTWKDNERMLINCIARIGYLTPLCRSITELVVSKMLNMEKRVEIELPQGKWIRKRRNVDKCF